MHGGKRSGAGRPPGARSKQVRRREEAVKETSEQLNAALGANAFAGDAHALLMSIYKDTVRPIDLRLDAAKAAIGYEKPKLATIEMTADIQHVDVTDRPLTADEWAAQAEDYLGAATGAAKAPN